MATPASSAASATTSATTSGTTRTDEFLAIVRGAWSGEPFDFEGEHYQVQGATARIAPDPLPEIYFGGASGAAEEVAARRGRRVPDLG